MFVLSLISIRYDIDLLWYTITLFLILNIRQYKSVLVLMYLRIVFQFYRV